MRMVATLVTDPLRAELSEDDAESVGRRLRAAGAETARPCWLNPAIACDVKFSGPEVAEARAAIAPLSETAGFDVIVQPTEGRRKQLLIADMDATIVEGETLDELAGAVGLKDRIATITERAMRGEIEFKAALAERVAMLKDLPVAALENTYRRLRLNAGALVLVKTMRAHGAFTILVSGGFRYFVSRIADAAGFEAFDCNDFEIVDERLTGRVLEPVRDKDAKLETLYRFARERDLALEATMAVGDGANDLPMIRAAGLGVAYRAKPVVIAAAPAAIRHGDLTALLYIQGYRRTEFAI